MAHELDVQQQTLQNIMAQLVRAQVLEEGTMAYRFVKLGRPNPTPLAQTETETETQKYTRLEEQICAMLSAKSAAVSKRTKWLELDMFEAANELRCTASEVAGAVRALVTQGNKINDLFFSLLFLFLFLFLLLFFSSPSLTCFSYKLILILFPSHIYLKAWCRTEAAKGSSIVSF